MALRQLLKFKNLTLDDLFRINFAGRVTEMNENGYKQFNLKIYDEELAAKLDADGWNIFHTKESERYGDPVAALPVEIRYHYEEDLKYLNPKIYKCTARHDGGKPRPVLLTEDLIPDLEKDEIVNIDLWITPSYWKKNGKSGIKAYVDSMWVTIEEDDIRSKYDWGDDEEELKFEE